MTEQQTKTYQSHGIQFDYPADWVISEEKSPEEMTVTVTDEELSFWTLSIYWERPDPQTLLQTAIELFRTDYTEIDIDPTEAELCLQPAEAYDIDFICFDFVNNVSLRALRTTQATLFVLAQTGGHTLDITRPILEEITDSLYHNDAPPLFPQ